jgi:hypothetical protein
MDLSALGYEQMVDSHECGSEFPGSVECRNLLTV